MLPELDPAPAIASFRELGYARVGRLFDEQDLAPLRERADDLMLGRAPREGMFFQHDAETGRYEDLPYGQGYRGPSPSYRKLEKLELDPLYRAFVENPLFEKLVRAHIPGDVVIYRAALFAKGAAGGSDLPWHQDGGAFWGLDRDPELQIWTALDDCPAEAGCVEVLPGSHLGGLASRLGGVVQPAQLAPARAEERALALPARAGEALLLHNYLWHRSGRNSTGRPRRALTVCYMSAATRCLRKKHAPREFFPVFRRGP